jgi:hypothetical protein
MHGAYYSVSEQVGGNTTRYVDPHMERMERRLDTSRAAVGTEVVGTAFAAGCGL